MESAQSQSDRLQSHVHTAVDHIVMDDRVQQQHQQDHHEYVVDRPEVPHFQQIRQQRIAARELFVGKSSALRSFSNVWRRIDAINVLADRVDNRVELTFESPNRIDIIALQTELSQIGQAR